MARVGKWTGRGQNRGEARNRLKPPHEPCDVGMIGWNPHGAAVRAALRMTGKSSCPERSARISGTFPDFVTVGPGRRPGLRSPVPHTISHKSCDFNLTAHESRLQPIFPCATSRPVGGALSMRAQAEAMPMVHPSRVVTAFPGFSCPSLRLRPHRGRATSRELRQSHTKSSL